MLLLLKIINFLIIESNQLSNQRNSDRIMTVNSKTNSSFNANGGGKLSTVEKFNLNNSSYSGRTITNFNKDKLLKDIHLFSNHLQRNLNPIPLANFINRPAINMNSPDLNLDFRSYLMNSPTNINKNHLVTNGTIKKFESKQKNIKDNVWNKKSTGRDDSFESFKNGKRKIYIDFFKDGNTDRLKFSDNSKWTKN